MFRMTASHNTQKRLVPLLSLPLPPPSQRLTNNLLPDAFTPSPTSLISIPESSPSLIRRARPVPQGAGFSYVSPLPLPFPYDFPAEEMHAEEIGQNGQDGDNVSLGEQHRRQGEESSSKEEGEESAEKRYERQMKEVEKVMRRYEVSPSELQSPQYPATTEGGLAGYIAPARRSQTYPSARLLGVSPAALRDCMPDLDIGDANDFIQNTAGRDGPDTYSSGPMAKQPTNDAEKARVQFSDVLAGRAFAGILPKDQESVQKDELAGCGVWAHKVSEPWKDETSVQRWNRRKEELKHRQGQSSTTYGGWSNAYAGHQFGSWAGQLGDGRAITLFETINKSDGERWEVQLKGAGRTPYSRFADGLATLGSSVREFLGSEAIAGLGIPTSRALSVISLPDVEVVRERRHVAAITSRLAPSWIRIGSFQLPASRSDWESVRLMGEYVSRVLFTFDGIPESQDEGSKREKWASKLLLESARRNAKMVAGWQSVGWTHGVLNTDNISVLGLTIDYGPYGFLDIFSPEVTPNHSDDSARYAYKLQPSMVLFAMRHLHTALSPIIGFEEQNGRAPSPGELIALSPDELKTLSEAGEASAKSALEETFVNETMSEWKRLFRRRLALEKEEEDEKSVLLDPLLDTLEDLDFTTTLRNLVEFPKILQEHVVKNSSDASAAITSAVDAFLPQWYDETRVLEYLRPQKREQAKEWLTKYAERTLRDVGDLTTAPADWGQKRSDFMKTSNPKFVLRNWVGEEVIQRLEKSDDTAFLARVLDMCTNPYRDWGSAETASDEEVRAEQKRMCELGEPLARNMPSCSS
ncbi:unnamed protein product [Sympodiomycopsis kandeliae]